MNVETLDFEHITALLARIRDFDDQEAAEELIRSHERIIFHVALSILRNRDDIEDVRQSCFLILVTKAGTIRDAKVFKAWIRKVAANESLRTLRENKSRQLREEGYADEFTVESATLIESIVEDERLRHLHSCLDGLNSEERHLVTLKFFGNFTYEQISKRTNMSIGKIRRRLDTVLNKMKRELKLSGLQALALPLDWLELEPGLLETMPKISDSEVHPKNQDTDITRTQIEPTTHLATLKLVSFILVTLAVTFYALHNPSDTGPINDTDKISATGINRPAHTQESKRATPENKIHETTADSEDPDKEASSSSVGTSDVKQLATLTPIIVGHLTDLGEPYKFRVDPSKLFEQEVRAIPDFSLKSSNAIVKRYVFNLEKRISIILDGSESIGSKGGNLKYTWTNESIGSYAEYLKIIRNDRDPARIQIEISTDVPKSIPERSTVPFAVKLTVDNGITSAEVAVAFAFGKSMAKLLEIKSLEATRLIDLRQYEARVVTESLKNASCPVEFSFTFRGPLGTDPKIRLEVSETNVKEHETGRVRGGFGIRFRRGDHQPLLTADGDYDDPTLDVLSVDDRTLRVRVNQHARGILKSESMLRVKIFNSETGQLQLTMMLLFETLSDPNQKIEFSGLEDFFQWMRDAKPHVHGARSDVNFRKMKLADLSDVPGLAYFPLSQIPDPAFFTQMYLNNSFFGENDLKSLTNFSNLKLFAARGSDLTDEQVKQLSGSPLQTVDLSGTNVNESSVEFLCAFPAMKQIMLNSINFDKVFMFPKGCTVNVLSLSDCGLKDDQLVNLTNLSTLGALSLSKNPLTGDFLKTLDSTNLVDIDLSNTNVSDSSLAHLSKATTLKSLLIKNCHKLTDNSIDHLIQIAQLTQLDISGSGISGNRLTELAGCKNLNSLIVGPNIPVKNRKDLFNLRPDLKIFLRSEVK